MTKRLTIGVSRLGWERGLAAETGKTRSHEKSQNNAARTPSRLHAVLGALTTVRLFAHGSRRNLSRRICRYQETDWRQLKDLEEVSANRLPPHSDENLERH